MKQNLHLGSIFFPIYSLVCHFASHLLDGTVCLHKELDVKQIWSIGMLFFFWDNAEVILVFPSASVITDNFVEKKNSPVRSHEPRLNWFPDKYKVSIRVTALRSDTILAQKRVHELLYFFIPSLSPSTPGQTFIYTKMFLKKEAYPIQAIMPQDHLIATCSVNYTALFNPSPRGWQTRQQAEPLQCFSDPLPSSISLLLLQLPPITDQVLMVLYWQNSHLSYPVTLTSLLLCMSASLPDKGPDASSDSG